jgi:hypothetical protein
MSTGIELFGREELGDASCEVLLFLCSLSSLCVPDKEDRLKTLRSWQSWQTSRRQLLIESCCGKPSLVMWMEITGGGNGTKRKLGGVKLGAGQVLFDMQAGESQGFQTMQRWSQERPCFCNLFTSDPRVLSTTMCVACSPTSIQLPINPPLLQCAV